MIHDGSKKDGKAKAEVERDGEILSAEQVEELIRKDVEVYMKQFRKSPQKLRQWFGRIVKQLELDEPDEYLEGDDGST